MRIKAAIILFFLMLTSVWADVALLPNGVQQFFDNNGNPLTSGTVTTYEAGTNTLKETFKDSLGTIPNINPIKLDAGGKAIIYGEGTYREVVKDKNNNLIWDAVTAPGGGGSTPTSVGDGNLVGTVLPWSGFIAPNQYVFAYGQELARSSFPEFFTAVTQKLNVICSAGSNTLTGIVDTSQINIGAPVEVSLCVIGSPTVLSKTTSTVTLSAPATVNTNTIATFFPYGNGDGVNTFNTPDLRGRVIAGRDNMGGSAAGRLSTPTYGANSPDALGGTGGSQITTVQFPQALVNTGTTISANSLASVSVPTIQPTITTNYIVKVSPDISLSVATGVASINSMTGTISCGSGLICTGNIINTITLSPTSLTSVGSGWGLTGGPCTTTCILSIPTANPPYGYGTPINLSLTTSVAANALTIAVKGNDGNDPSANNPVLVPFRNDTVSNGAINWVPLTNAFSLVIPSGATLGTSNATPFRYWLAFARDTGNVLRFCIINTLNGNDIYPLAVNGVINSLGTPANATQQWYCGASVSNKAYTIIGYITYESGLGTAGTYVSIPNVIQLYGPGVKLPGDLVQYLDSTLTTVSTGAGTFTSADVIPTQTNGTAFIAKAITTQSAANILDADYQFMGSNSAASSIVAALYFSATNNAISVSSTQLGTVNRILAIQGKYTGLTSIISTMSLIMRVGGDSGGTTTINGVSGGRLYGGSLYSYIKIREIQR